MLPRNDIPQSLLDEKNAKIFFALNNNMLPSYFDVKLILTEFAELKNSERIRGFFQELEFAALFVVKVLQNYCVGTPMLNYQYSKIFADAARITLRGELNSSPEQDYYTIHFREDECYTYQAYIVRTYIKQDEFTKTMLTSCEPELTEASQKLLIDALEAVHTIQHISSDYYMSADVAREKPDNLTQHFDLFLSIFTYDSIKHEGLTLLNSDVKSMIELMLNAKNIKYEDKIAYMKKVLLEMRLTILELYSDFLVDINFKNKTKEVSVLTAEEYKRLTSIYLYDENIVKIALHMRDIVDDKLKLTMLLKMGSRLEYIMDALKYQWSCLENPPNADVQPFLQLQEFFSNQPPVLNNSSFSEVIPVQPLIDYTTKEDHLAERFNKFMAEAATKKFLFCNDSRSKTIIYCNCVGVIASVSLDTLRDWILNNEFASLFLRRKVIFDELKMPLIRVNQLFLDLSLLNTVVMQIIDRLSGGLVANNLLRIPAPSDEIVGFYFLHDTHGSKKKLIMATIEGLLDNPALEEKGRLIIEKYMNVDLLSEYLNPLMVGDLGYAYTKLAKFYLEAFNMLLQINFLLAPACARQNLSFFIKDGELLQRTVQCKHLFQQKKWYEVMTPNPPLVESYFNQLLTQPPSVANLLSDKIKQLESISPVIVKPRIEVKECKHEVAITLKEKKQDQIAKTPKTYVGIQNSKTEDSKKDPVSADSKKDSKNDSKPADPVVLQTPKQRLAALQECYATTRNQLEKTKATVAEMRDDFRKLNYEMTGLKQDLYEEIPFVLRGIRNRLDKWTACENTLDLARTQLNSIDKELSAAKNVVQATKLKMKKSQGTPRSRSNTFFNGQASTQRSDERSNAGVRPRR